MDIRKEFRDYAVKHRGLNGLAFDEYMAKNNQAAAITSSYISPTIIEERQLNVSGDRNFQPVSSLMG